MRSFSKLLIFALLLALSKLSLCVIKRQKKASSVTKASDVVGPYNFSSSGFDNDNVIYWSPTKVGLLQNFLNLKYVYQIARYLQKTVVINDTRSSVVFCDVFEFPESTISCGKAPNEPCIQHPNLVNILISPTEDIISRYLDTFRIDYVSLTLQCIFLSIPNGSVCIRGPLYLEKIGKSREHIVRALNNKLQLKLSGHSDQLLAKFKQALGIKKGQNFTVVNWNKGLEFGAMFNSMRISQLVAKVKESTSDAVVYVITSQNKPNSDNADFSSLGFRTFHNVGNGHFFYLSDVQIFELEISLALQASTYLDWSISAAHDLIESLRKRAGKTHCINQLPYCKMSVDLKVCAESVSFCTFDQIPPPLFDSSQSPQPVKTLITKVT